MAVGIGTQIPSKNKGHRKRSNQSADDNPAQTKRGRTQNSELAASPASDEPQCTIFQHLHTLEVESKRKRPLSGYMKKVQYDISPVMRTKLVDWLVEVAEEYRLGSDTLFLAVNYIDRFLSTRKVSVYELQLLGVTCMLVASKYEEIRPPRVEKFASITEYTYTKDDIMQMEIVVLKTLEYEMGNPTTKTFLRMFASRAAQEENENSVLSKSRFRFLCDYIAELSLTDYYVCVGHIPSIVAASAIFLARFTMQPESHPWTQALQKHTGYDAFELKGCVTRLHDLLYTRGKSAPAVRRKYMDSWFKYVPSMSPPNFIPARFFKVSRASTLY